MVPFGPKPAAGGPGMGVGMQTCGARPGRVKFPRVPLGAKSCLPTPSAPRCPGPGGPLPKFWGLSSSSSNFGGFGWGVLDECGVRGGARLCLGRGDAGAFTVGEQRDAWFFSNLAACIRFKSPNGAYTEYLILTAQADGHGAVKLAGFVLTPKSTVNLVFSSLLITANTSAVLVLNAVGLL